MTPRNDKGELLARWKETNEIVALVGVIELIRAKDIMQIPGVDISVRSPSAANGYRLVKASELEVPIAR